MTTAFREIPNGFFKLKFPETAEDRQKEVIYGELTRLAIAVAAVALTAIFAGAGTAILLSSLYAAYELFTMEGNWIRINEQKEGLFKTLFGVNNESEKMEQLTQGAPILRAITRICLVEHLNKLLKQQMPPSK